MESIDILRQIWYLLIGVLLIGYSLLDGFDLGVGTLLPFLAKKEDEKRTLFNAIGPFWDGNEVWLLTGGGALFAAFPQVYATVFSGFYLAMMLVLFALIFRAVSLEFRAHDEKRKKFWEWSFIAGSFLPSLLFGVDLCNVLVGVPLNEHMDFTGSFFTLLRPYPLVIGLLGLSAILLQGSTFTILKTTGEIRDRAVKITGILRIVFIALFIVSGILTFIYIPDSLGNILAWVAFVIIIASWFLLKNTLSKGEDGKALLYSSISFIGLWGIVGSIHFPNLVKASNDAALSLTISNASSSLLTLKVMLIIALIGMPFVIGYTIYVYKIFSGKIKLDDVVY